MFVGGQPYKIVWRRYGNKSWNDWWVKLHGAQIPREGTFQEHVSFVNYDLARNGLPKISVTGEGAATISLHSADELRIAVNLLRYHGFEFE